MSMSDEQDICKNNLTRYSWAQKVQEFAIFWVHDGSLDKFNYRVAAVLKFWVAP